MVFRSESRLFLDIKNYLQNVERFFFNLQSIKICSKDGSEIYSFNRYLNNGQTKSKLSRRIGELTTEVRINTAIFSQTITMVDFIHTVNVKYL